VMAEYREGLHPNPRSCGCAQQPRHRARAEGDRLRAPEEYRAADTLDPKDTQFRKSCDRLLQQVNHEGYDRSRPGPHRQLCSGLRKIGDTTGSGVPFVVKKQPALTEEEELFRDRGWQTADWANAGLQLIMDREGSRFFRQNPKGRGTFVGLKNGSTRLIGAGQYNCTAIVGQKRRGGRTNSLACRLPPITPHSHGLGGPLRGQFTRFAIIE